MSFIEKLRQLSAQQPGDESKKREREKARQEQERLHREQEWDDRVAALDGVAMRTLAPTLEEVKRTYFARGKGRLSLLSPKGHESERKRFPVPDDEGIGRPYTKLELEWVAPDSDLRLDRRSHTGGYYAGKYHIFVTLMDDGAVLVRGAGSKSPEVTFNLNEETWKTEYEAGLLEILADPQVCVDDTPPRRDFGGAL